MVIPSMDRTITLLGVAQVHLKILALHLHTVADAVDVQLLLEALRDADHHVVDERTGQAVQRAVFLFVVRAGDEDLVPSTEMVMFGWKAWVKRGLGPFTATTLASTVTVTPAGIFMGFLPIRDMLAPPLITK